MKHNLLKSVIISVILLMGVSNALGATIDNISDVWMEGSMNSWANKPTNWKFSKAASDDNNHYIGTFYIPYSSTKYEFKIRCAGSGWTDGSLFAIGGYWFTSDNFDFNKNMPNKDVGNDLIECISTTSGYIKLDCEFWGNYNSNSRLVIKQSDVAALSPSLSASSTSLIAGGTSTLTASCSGGSGGYTYSYKVTCDGNDVTNSTLNTKSGSSVKFTAPTVTGKKTYTITVTAKDSHALLSGLATKTATKTITVEEAHTVTVSYKYGSTTIKANTTTNNVKYETASSITAPTITGYKFSSWTLGNGITNKSANTTTNPISITTKSSGTYTLTANYTEDLTSTWHIVGEPTSIFHGAAWAAHNDNMLKKTTGASTASKGSLTIDVKTLPANNDSYQFKVLNTNGIKWYGWSTGENHFWMNQTNTTGVYTNQNNLYFIPNALGEYKFDVDWSGEYPSLKVTFPTAYTVTFGKGTGGSSVTAKYNSTSFNTGTKVQSGKTVTFTQTASAGYTFKEWNTKSDGTGTKLSTNATYTRTVAATNTVYAIYTKNPDKTIYLEPTGHWNSDKAVFQAHVWQTGKTGVNLKMEGIGDPSHADGDNKSPYRYYKVEVPAEYDNILFFRKDNFATANENAWNKTGNLTIPVDNNVLYTITSAGKGKAEGYNPAATGTWKAPNIIYTITLGYCDFGTYGIKYNGQSYFSKPKENVTIDVPAGAQIEILEGQPFSNAYTGDVIKSKPTKEDIGQTLTINGDITLDDNFVTKEPHVVYLGVPDGLTDWTSGTYGNFLWSWNTKSSFSLIESTRNFKIGNTTYYEYTIPAGRHSLCFQRKTGVNDNGTPQKESVYLPFQIPLTDVNCFTLKNEKDGNRYKGTWGVLPAQPGDYRLLYVEQVVEKSIVNGDEWKTVITRKKAHPSNIVRNSEITAEGKIVSLHTYKERKYQAIKDPNATNDEDKYYTSSSNSEIILQKYDGTNWNDVEWHMVYGPLETLPIMANLPGRRNTVREELYYDDGIEIIKNDLMPNGEPHPDQGNGVWNFVITQDNEGNATLDLERTHRYKGEYYIRTDVANGGWDYYTNFDNYMTRSDISKQHSNYSHYFCKWVGEANVNVKYTIANDYGIAISDTLEADKTDLWGNELANKMVGDDQLLPAKANVRFSWNEKTNGLHRAYIAGTTNVADRFLVLEGDANIFDVTGSALNISGLSANEQIFRDNSNWIYYADVQMKPMAPVKVTAKYDGHTQYFIGKQNETVTLLQGTGEEKYLIRMLYDFKTNQLISAYVPGASDKVNAISTNLMLIRQDDKDATQLEFNNVTPHDMETIATDRRAYGVIEFTKKRLINGLNEKDEPVTELQKGLYWISFPFDVDLSEVISFGEYGKHWVIEEYDGATRAAEGCWLESESFWIYHWDQNITLEAGKGYVIGLDVDLIRNDNLFGLSGDRPIGIYFPSKSPVNQKIVNQTTAKTYVEPHECGIVRNTPKGDRRIADSHWNVVGTPSYVNTIGNYNNFTANIETKPEELKYYYEWLGEYNHYAPVAAESQTFKPLRAYMVQYAGYINWKSIWNVHPAAIAAKQSSDDIKEHRLRLEIQQNGNKADHTFVRLQDEDGVTDHFDFNHDLCKIINAGANIYSFVTTETYPIEVAANVLPIQETIIPLGVVSAAAGEYTFAMPEGTDGIVVELIDYENNTRTNMLLDEYTVNLGKGTFESRFALHVKPNKTTTSLEDVNTNTTGVKKYLIDGVLYMQKDGALYDAQGKLVR